MMSLMVCEHEEVVVRKVALEAVLDIDLQSHVAVPGRERGAKLDMVPQSLRYACEQRSYAFRHLDRRKADHGSEQVEDW